MNNGLYVEINKRARELLKNRLSNISNGYKNLTDNASRAFAETFRDIARARLKERISTNKNDLSSLLTKIKAKQVGKTWVVTVDNRTGEENIMAFLEYGTGLAGKGDRHPLAGSIGWEYAINEIDYHEIPNGKVGWFFKDTGYNYVDNDEVLAFDDGSTSRTVFSDGIIPVRYIYDTRIDMARIINLSFATKKGFGKVFNLKSFYSRLNKERSKWGLSQIILTT